MIIQNYLLTLRLGYQSLQDQKLILIQYQGNGEGNEEEIFIEIERAKVSSDVIYSIFYDKGTRVKYMFSRSGTSADITVLYKADSSLDLYK